MRHFHRRTSQPRRNSRCDNSRRTSILLSYYQVGLPHWISQISILTDQGVTKAILMLDIDRALSARAQMISAQPAALKALSQIETVEVMAV